jgi:hypothetical protein
LQLAKLAAGACWAFLLLVAVICGAAELDIFEVKARYIYNFVKYITWPEGENQGEEFVIAVMDAPNLNAALTEVLREKDLQGKPFKAVFVDSATAQPQARAIYFKEARGEKLAQLIEAAPPWAVTIGEGPNFLAKGGMIEFNINEGKVRFSVNLRKLRDKGFAVESKLLSAAQEVHK